MLLSCPSFCSCCCPTKRFPQKRRMILLQSCSLKCSMLACFPKPTHLPPTSHLPFVFPDRSDAALPKRLDCSERDIFLNQRKDANYVGRFLTLTATDAAAAALCLSHPLVGLVVKASASEAEDPKFYSRLDCGDFFQVKLYQ